MQAFAWSLGTLSKSAVVTQSFCDVVIEICMQLMFLPEDLEVLKDTLSTLQALSEHDNALPVIHDSGIHGPKLYTFVSHQKTEI